MEENYQDVGDLPLDVVKPPIQLPTTNLSETFKKFESNYPQFTKVNSATAPQQETIDQAMDRINNTKLNVNYVPNIVAPVTVDLNAKRYENVDLTLPEILSGNAEQYAAQTQSYWDRLWNDTKVTGANLGLGFATAFTSVYDMINDGSFIPSEGSATSNLGKISQNFAEENSNFKTQYDIDNPIKSLLLPAFLTGSSSGWGEITKSASIGLGTTAGIIAQEAAITAATGGIGTFPALAANIRNIIRNSSVLVRAAEVAGGLRAGTMSLGQGAKTILGLETAISAANTTKNVINLSKNAVRSALSAYGESAFEAQETRDTFTAEKVKEFEQLNGRLPNEIEVKRIKDIGEQAHDARFILNFAALSISNMPFNTSIFKQFDDVLSISEQAAAKGLKYTGRAGDGFEKAFQLTSNWWSKNAITKGMKTAIEAGQPFAKNIITGKSITWNEGFEEGYQFWVDKATNNYYNTIYNKGTNDIIDGTFQDTAYGLAKSFYQTKEELITTEGLQNIIGGILGGTGQSIVAKGVETGKNIYNANKIANDPKNNTTFKQEYDKLTGQWKEGSQFRIDTTTEIKQAEKDLIDIQKAININSITGDLSSKIESVRGAYTGAGLMQETNSKVAFEKLKDITKFHTIAPMVMKGQTEILKDELTKSIKDSTDEEFKALTGLEEVNDGIRQKYATQVLNDIEKVEKSVKRNLSTFRNKFQKGTEEYEVYENAKKVFAFHGYISENMMERRKQLEAENSILFNAPNISSALQLVFTDKGKDLMLNTIDDKINGINTILKTFKPVTGEEVELDDEAKTLIKNLNFQKERFEKLKETTDSFKGDTKKEVIDFLIENLNAFDQTDIVLNNSNLNAENQLEELLNRYNDYTEISNNIADHLETYNNLVQSYSNSNKLKGVLSKYREQGMVVQSSFENLKDIDKINKVYEYFDEKTQETPLPQDSEYFKEIVKGIIKLRNENAELEEFKELIDKNIEQYKREEAEQERKQKEAEKTNTSNIDDSILNYKSFTTANGSIYNILPDGAVQRFKTVLNDPNYLGIDKGENALREPSDIIMFFDEESRIGKVIDYFNNGALTRSIPSQTYLLQGTEDNYRIIKNNLELNLNEDVFLLTLPLEVATNINVENLTSNQIETYTQRFIDAYGEKNNTDKKYFELFKFYYFGKINNDVSFIPKIGLKTFDYKVNKKTGLQGNRHVGNKVISIEKKEIETQTEDDITNLEFLELLKKIQQNVIDDKRVGQQIITELEQEIETLKGEKEKVENQESNNTKENLLMEIDKTITIINNKIEKIKNTATSTDLDEAVNEGENTSKEPKPTQSTPTENNSSTSNTEEEKTISLGSINSKTVQTTVFVNEKGEVVKLEDNPTVLSQLANNVYDVLLNGDINIEELEFKFTENEIKLNNDGSIVKAPLADDTAFRRATSPDSIQVTRNVTVEGETKSSFVTLIQSPDNLFLDIPLILKHAKNLTEKQRNKLGEIEISLVQALEEGNLTSDIFEEIKNVTYKDKDGNKKRLIAVRENFTEFKNIILTQKQLYEELKSAKNIKSKFNELYELEPYANGMNLNKKVEFSEVNFTKDLPFNNIGNWKNPIFTILSNNKISAENVNVSNEELVDIKLKVKAKLDELKKTNLKYYNILIDQATFFTAFTTDTGEIFIKPIILKKANSGKNFSKTYLNLQDEAFDENGKYIKGSAEKLSKQYAFFAYDQKKDGQSIRLKFIENDKGQLNVAFIVFSDRSDDVADYYINNLNKETLKKLLDKELEQKPTLAPGKEGKGFPKELEVFGVTIVEKIIDRDVSILLDGTYPIEGVNNPTSIFQNVGFRLKFKEKQEQVDPVIPKSFVAETPPVVSKEDSDKTDIDAKKADIKRRMEEDLLNLKTLELEDTFAPKGTVSEKLLQIGKFFQNNFGWKFEGKREYSLYISKENNRAEFDIDGLEVNLEEGQTFRVMGGGAYPTFTPQELINAKYNAELNALEQTPTTEVELPLAAQVVEATKKDLEDAKKEVTIVPNQTEIDVKADIERELSNLGQKQLTQGFERLNVAKNFKEKAAAFISIEQNVNQGAILSDQQKNLLQKAKEEFESEGYDIIILTTLPQGTKAIAEPISYNGEILTKEQVDALEKHINKLEKKGEEIDLNEIPHPVSRVIKPYIGKDGKMIQAPEVITLVFDTVEQLKEAIDKSKKAEFKKETAADKINAKYNAELAKELYKEMKAGKLITQMTPFEQKVADTYITEELRKSVDEELKALEEQKTNGNQPLMNQTEIETEREKIIDNFNPENNFEDPVDNWGVDTTEEKIIKPEIFVKIKGNDFTKKELLEIEDPENPAVQKTINEIDRIQRLLDLELAALEQSNAETSLQPTIANDNLQEIADKVEQLGKEKLKGIGSDDGTGKKTPVWEKLKEEFKNESNLSEIISKFAELENIEELNPTLGLGKLTKLKNQKIIELKSYFIESKSTPITQRAIIDNKEIEEIAKQYTINCK